MAMREVTTVAGTDFQIIPTMNGHMDNTMHPITAVISKHICKYIPQAHFAISPEKDFFAENK